MLWLCRALHHTLAGWLLAAALVLLRVARRFSRVVMFCCALISVAWAVRRAVNASAILVGSSIKASCYRDTAIKTQRGAWSGQVVWQLPHWQSRPVQIRQRARQGRRQVHCLPWTSPSNLCACFLALPPPAAPASMLRSAPDETLADPDPAVTPVLAIAQF